jgi:hypothetical protein
VSGEDDSVKAAILLVTLSLTYPLLIISFSFVFRTPALVRTPSRLLTRLSVLSILNRTTKKKRRTPWPVSARELYRPRDRHLSAKLVLTFADRGCHVVGVTDR